MKQGRNGAAGRRRRPGHDGSGSAPEPGQSALSWRTICSTYLPALILALGTGIALPAVPTLAKSFGVGFGEASGVVTAFLIGNLVGALPAGWVIDRFGRRVVLFGGPVLTSGVAFLVAAAHSFPELLILRFFDGIAAQAWLMARIAAISHGASAGQRGREVSWMFSMNYTGKLAGPVIGGFLAGTWGPRAPFAAYAGLALLALVPVAMTASSQTSQGGQRQPSRGTRDGHHGLKSLRAMVTPRLAYFAVALCAGLTRGPLSADLLHLYAAFTYHLGAREIGYLATGAAALTLPIGFVAGWMLDRFGRKHTMIPSFAGLMMAMAGLAVSAFAGLSLIWYVFIFLLAVAMQAMTSGSIQTIGADVAPPEARGTFLGLWRFAGQGGSTLSPVLFAVLAAQVNYGSAFLFVAVSAAAVAFLLLRYVPETRSAPQSASAADPIAENA